MGRGREGWLGIPRVEESAGCSMRGGRRSEERRRTRMRGGNEERTVDRTRWVVSANRG